MMDALEWLSATYVAVSLRRSATLYMFVNAAHILAIGLLVGAILPLDLRLLGFIRAVPLAIIGPFLSRAAAIGLCAAILTGICLFSVRPAEYAANQAFLAKIGLLAFGILNAVVLHLTPAWKGVVAGGRAGRLVRISAAFSFATWVSALVAGRWIGFL
ncbi:DUF6644 family protein [Rhizobium binxianense]